MIMQHYYRPIAAVCGEYRRHSDELSMDEEEAPEPKVYVNELDAIAVENALRDMPAHLSHAVKWHYIGSVPKNCIINFRKLSDRQIKDMVEQVARRLG